MSPDAPQQGTDPRSTHLVEVAKQFYAMVLTDFDAAVREHLAERFVLENYLPSEIPFGGRLLHLREFNDTAATAAAFRADAS